MSAPDTTCNGWTNYETWCVALWWDEDPFLANQRRPEMIVNALAFTEPAMLPDQHDRAVRVLSEAIKDYVTDPSSGMIPDLEAGLAADLLGASLRSVNWREIATNWLEEDA